MSIKLIAVSIGQRASIVSLDGEPRKSAKQDLKKASGVEILMMDIPHLNHLLLM